MNKVLLGIIGVMLLHFTFGIYLSNETAKELAANEARKSMMGTGSSRTQDHATQPPAAVITVVEADAEEPMAAETLVVSNDDALDTRAEIQGRRSSAKMVWRRPAVRFAASHAKQITVQREYFGNMVVERTFGPVRTRSKNNTSGARRQIFGRMMVERRSEISSLRAANGSKTKKNFYYAKNLPI